MDGKFIFGGVDSAAYNVWIKAGGTYGAASRRFTTEVVPGRDGALTIDDGAFEEKEHSYECHIGDDFPANIQAFRNAIMAQIGRVRLTDSYHPDEFYRARYMRGLEPDVAALAKAGEFTMAFSRDPRRFLVSGEAAQNIPAATSEELSGNAVSFDGKDGLAAITGAVVSVVPQQSGSGDPSPTNIRTITGWTGATISVSKNLFDADSVTFLQNTLINASGAEVTNNSYKCTADYIKINPDTTYTLQFIKGTDTSLACSVAFYDADNVFLEREVIIGVTAAKGLMSASFTSPQDAEKIRVNFPKVGTADVQIELGDIASDYNRTVNTHPITWEDSAGTVYAGTLDASTGVLTSTFGIHVIDGSKAVTASAGGFYYSIGGGAAATVLGGIDAVCSHYKVTHQTGTGAEDFTTTLNNRAYSGTNGRAWFFDSRFSTAADFKQYLVDQYSAGTPVQYVFALASPLTYQLTAAQIATITGINNVWADTGDISLTIANPSTLENPTDFAAKPKIRIYGHGTVNIGSRSFTVSGNYPYVDIDCELGDATYNGVNANNVVSFSGGFPVLNPGTNYISYSGITSVEITPRWWRL